jgi:hypothetical protein
MIVDVRKKKNLKEIITSILLFIYYLLFTTTSKQPATSYSWYLNVFEPVLKQK